METLDEFKRSRMRDINQRTDEVLARGFTYSGVNVSLTVHAQLRYEVLRATTGLFSSAIIEAADDMSPALTLGSFGMAAFSDAQRAYVKSIHDAANVLKKSIRDAADYAAVEAVVDTR